MAQLGCTGRVTRLEVTRSPTRPTRSSRTAAVWRRHLASRWAEFSANRRAARSAWETPSRPRPERSRALGDSTRDVELGGPTSADIHARHRFTMAKGESSAAALALWPLAPGVRLPADEAADLMVHAARDHSGELERIVFCVHGDAAEHAFRQAVG